MNLHFPENHRASDVLDFWFPENGQDMDSETFKAFWRERMHGGMDAAIIEHFSELTLAAAQGELDQWSETPRGRLALLIVLDQFSLSLWRDTPAAYSQDIRATRFALEGIANGEVDRHTPWEAGFFVIAISHCEGPDHLERMHSLTPVVDRIAACEPTNLPGSGEGFRKQHECVTNVIRRFGRHPHRNVILGRISTKAEEAYIAIGDFPHLP